MDLLTQAKNFLFKRQRAYIDTFNPESESARRVIKDLSDFCRANESTFHPDPRVQAQLEGRRETWLRIQHHIKLDPDQLWIAYGRKDRE